MKKVSHLKCQSADKEAKIRRKSLLWLMFLYIEILRSTTDAIQIQSAGHINVDLPSRLPLIIADSLMYFKDSCQQAFEIYCNKI